MTIVASKMKKLIQPPKSFELLQKNYFFNKLYYIANRPHFYFIFSEDRI